MNWQNLNVGVLIKSTFSLSNINNVRTLKMSFNFINYNKMCL